MARAGRGSDVIPIKSHQESTMNKDQVKGRIDEVKGKVKETVGKIVGNDELQRKGTIKNAQGKVRANYGDLKEDVKKSI
jgi:uncharacterized protein YjbJ (UPF0337 family)